MIIGKVFAASREGRYNYNITDTILQFTSQPYMRKDSQFSLLLSKLLEDLLTLFSSNNNSKP